MVKKRFDLDMVLKLHVKWLNGEDGGERANLRYANLDFSCLPLWCGSFNMKVDDNIIEQILTHVKMLDISKCSKENQELVKLIPDRVKDKLRMRHDLEI